MRRCCYWIQVIRGSAGIKEVCARVPVWGQLFHCSHLGGTVTEW